MNKIPIRNIGPNKYDDESKCPKCGVRVGWLAKVNQKLVWHCEECGYQLTPKSGESDVA